MSDGPTNATSAQANELAQEPAVVADASAAPSVIIPDPPPEAEPSASEPGAESSAAGDDPAGEGEAEAPNADELGEETGERLDAGSALRDAAGCGDAEPSSEDASESEGAVGEAQADDAVASEEPSADADREEQRVEEPREQPPAEAAPVPPAPPASAAVLRHRLPGPLALLKLDKVDEDSSFRLRDEGEIDSLATSIAKLGQLFPIDLRLRPPDRFQVVTGFRRVAALRLLKRERVLARVHTDVSDEDALRLSLADLLESKPVAREELAVLRDRLREEGRLTSAVADTLERAISPPDETLSPETVDDPEEEVDLDTLAQDVIARLAAINQDLAIVAELWSALDRSQRETLLEQLGYSSQLVTYLRGLR